MISSAVTVYNVNNVLIVYFAEAAQFRQLRRFFDNVE